MWAFLRDCILEWLTLDPYSTLTMLIQIHEKEQTELGDFKLRVIIDEKHSYAVTLTNPHTPTVEEGLEWYFEEYINEPYIAETTVLREKQTIQVYGTHLFEQLFGNEEARKLYLQGVEHEGFDHLIFEIASAESSIAFQGILWETLRDPTFREEPLVAKGATFYRKSLKEPDLPTKVDTHPEINLLIVTARPSEENDVDYRTIQRPLIDLIRKKTHLLVKPFILRPGTFKALKDHLAEVKSGYYHIVHFDLHGEVVSYKELKRERKKGNVRFSYGQTFGKQASTFNIRYGQEDLQEFEGRKAFLFFESEEKGMAEPYSAQEIATLLRDNRIPVCILNACQSAKQEGTANETSLAKFFQEQGLDFVLAMRYSISVSAAEKLMERFYNGIFDDNSIDDAIALARMSLYNEKTRKANLGFRIDLEDWVLPVIYKRNDVQFSLRKFTEKEEEQRYEDRKKQALFPRLRYEFIGRDLDILKIEKLLLPPYNHLLIRGMVGVGKSALLSYLAAWWTVTRFRSIRNAFQLDLKDKVYTHTDLIDELIQFLYDDTQIKTLENKSLTVREGKVLDTLNRFPYALLLDNIFKYDDQETIDFLSRIQDASFVVYGSVNGEEALSARTFGDHVYRLDGLDPDAAYELAQRIIKKTTSKDLQELMVEDKFSTEHLLKLLAGFPLAMELVLPFLKDKTVVQVLDEFREGSLPIF